MTLPALQVERLARLGWIPPHRRYDHPERRRVRESPARFKWVCGARRSGKTIDALEYLILGHGPKDPKSGLRLHRGALTVDERVDDPTFVVAAPTYGMLHRIWWDKLKRRVPRTMVDAISEKHMEIRYVNGAKVLCVGMDSPQRAEGIPIDGLIFDEFAYAKIMAWRQSLRPALSTPGRLPGWAIIQGKPFGRNHFYTGWTKARDGLRGHQAFHWKSSVVMSARELAQARLDLDPQSFRQEYEASFESWTGLAYYTFGPHNWRPAVYDPNRPLAFAWDFGTSPGTVAVCQMHDLPATHCHHCGAIKPPTVPVGDSWLCGSCRQVAYAILQCLVVIGEAYQQINSTTDELCRMLIQQWADKVRPNAPVYLYGDPAGWAQGTRGRSSDWDQIQESLGRVFNVRMKVRRAQPPQRDRVNALVRLCASDLGQTRLFVNKTEAPHTWADFENTVLKQDGSGQIDKNAANGLYSHLTDALTYLALEEFPRHDAGAETEEVGT